MTIEIIVHSTGVGHCSLLGKEGEGMVVTFKDGTVKEGFLSHRAFQQLIKMKCGQQQPQPVAAATTSNGTSPASGPARPPAPLAQPVPSPGNGPAKS